MSDQEKTETATKEPVKKSRKVKEDKAPIDTAPITPAAEGGNNKSTILKIVGAILLLCAGGAAGYAVGNSD